MEKSLELRKKFKMEMGKIPNHEVLKELDLHEISDDDIYVSDGPLKPDEIYNYRLYKIVHDPDYVDWLENIAIKNL